MTDTIQEITNPPLPNFNFSSPKSRKMGLRMNGLEGPIEDLIKNHPNLQTSDIYTYLEIGTAGATTLTSIRNIIKENRSAPHICFGFDIPNCAKDNINELIVNFCGKPNVIRREEMESGRKIFINEMYLILLENPQEFIRNQLDTKADLVFIDGIHSKNWVTNDFLSVENKVKEGGYIIFHDYCEVCQNTDPQIGGGFIEVRQAVKELGLIDNIRPGWEFVQEILGSRTTLTGTGDGNGACVIRKL